MAEVLSTVQLQRLTEHKYSAEGCSLLEPYMQHFWRWLVEQIPLTWAPNAITLTGLIVNVLTTCILMYYSPDARQNVPAWAYLLCAAGLFVYQALDAIDGKQARRTKSSSPLGELFDHGCDALSIVFVVIGTCIAMQLGRQPLWMFFECFAAMFLFYAAHWQTYVSGTLKFSRIDVTEAQFTVMSIFILSAILGNDFWNYSLPVLGLELKMGPLYFSIFTAILSCQMYFSVILMEGGSGKNGSTIAGTSVVSPILPIGVVTLLAVMIWQKSTTHLFELHPCLYVLSFGLVIVKVTNKLVVAHMTKSEMGLLDSSFIGPGMLFLNQYFNTVFNEYFVLWMCFFYCTADLLRYSVVVCWQICDYLNIFCFKITLPDDEGLNSHHSNNGSHDNNSHQKRPVTRSLSKLNKRK